jgi:hypothetical protein
MATAKLETGTLPKSSAGRKAIEADTELVASLVSHFEKNGLLDESGQPLFAGPVLDYDTEGKATAAGRRHAKPVSEKIGKAFRVNIQQLGNDGPYRWRLYVPAAVAKAEDSVSESED